jgi:hypothetical protein
MLNEIAIRLYDNPKYGTTYGKAQYRHAIFNGSADIKNPSVKYLLERKLTITLTCHNYHYLYLLK